MSEESVDEQPEIEEVAPIAGIGTLVFGKWDASEVTCRDPGISPYINLYSRCTSHWREARKLLVWKSTIICSRAIRQQTHAYRKVYR